MRGLAKLAVGSGNLALVDRPERPAGAGEVLVSVLAAGVCGTDLHIDADEYPSSPPVTLGHEVCGEVIGVGAEVPESWLGVRIVSETYFSTCGACPSCRDGRPNLCRERCSIGSRADGAFADRVVLPAAGLHVLPDWVSDHAGPLVEPLACVCNCLLDPSVIQPGDQVLITGPGPVGLLAAQVARSAGGDVTVVGLSSDGMRLEVAASLGFGRATGVEEAREVDVAIECSGSQGGARSCLEALRPGGTWVQVGVFGKDVTVPLDLVLLKELRVRAGFASTPQSWQRAMTLLADRRLDLDSLVTRVSPLEAWAAAFEDLRAGRGLKQVLDPRLRGDH